MSNRPTRIAHVLPYSAQVQGGHSNAILAIMDAELRHGLDLRAVSPVADIPQAERRNIDRFPVRELDFGAVGFTTAAVEDLGKPAMVHFHGFIRAYLALGRELRRRGVPYVLTSHGNLNFRSFTHGVKKFIYLNFVTSFFRQAAGLHFLTGRERLRCARLLPGWKGPVLVQGNIIEVPDPESVAPAPRSELGIPANAFLFAFLGRLDVPCKGLDLLVRAFSRLPGEPWLILIGGDWAGGRQSLEKLAAELRCAGRLLFVGPQFGDRKWALLRTANAFVGPSRWESFGIAHAEAIGLGLPTIVSAGMNLARELSEQSAALESGLSVEELVAAMATIAQDESLRNILSRSGRQWVLEHCSAAAAGPRFEQFYREVIGSTATARRSSDG